MRYNVRVADIRKWNNLRSNTIRIGQKLAIWLEDGYYDGVNKALASKAQPAKTAVGSNNSHIVQEGDTLWEISRKYEGLSVEKLKKLNNLAGNAIKPGQVLRLKES
jgi:membrane-bound lytic murein transglycosylase D